MNSLTHTHAKNWSKRPSTKQNSSFITSGFGTTVCLLSKDFRASRSNGTEESPGLQEIPATAFRIKIRNWEGMTAYKLTYKRAGSEWRVKLPFSSQGRREKISSTAGSEDVGTTEAPSPLPRKDTGFVPSSPGGSVYLKTAPGPERVQRLSCH